MRPRSACEAAAARAAGRSEPDERWPAADGARCRVRPKGETVATRSRAYAPGLICCALAAGDERKGNVMNARELVHHLVASRLHVADRNVDDAHTFRELGLAPLDLVLIVLRLESCDPGDGQFPVAALAEATTIGELVGIVERWAGRVPVASRPMARCA